MDTKAIYQVSAVDCGNNGYRIIHHGMSVKRVFDMNGHGTLIPVEFTQQGNQVFLKATPSGNLYVKYHKEQ